MKDLPEILRILYDAQVEFVVIGGAAMLMQGSAYVTKDADFCYARTRQNFERLSAALKPYHPTLRGAPPDLPFAFDARAIAQGTNFTLTTDLGALDFLEEVTGLGSYEAVRKAADIKIIQGMEILVLSLSGLIASKKAAGRKKDLYVLPELEALEELKRKTGAE